MTDKELKRLRRAQLRAMLLMQTEENEKLKSQLSEIRTQLDNRQIRVGKTGSIAEAVLQLNDVFQTAEAAALQYMDNIQRLSDEKEAACRRMEEETRKKVEIILAEAEAYAYRTRFQADQYRKQVMEETQAVLRDQCGQESLLSESEKEQEQ